MNVKKLIAVILIICFTAFLLLTSKEIVISGSMQPSITTGSLAFVNKNIKFNEIKKGDIISYDFGNTKVIHRVVKKTEKGLITKGDNNDNVDFGIVTKNQLNGKYLFSIPLLGYLIMFMKEYKLIFLIIIIVFIVIFNKKEVRKNE